MLSTRNLLRKVTLAGTTTGDRLLRMAQVPSWQWFGVNSQPMSRSLRVSQLEQQFWVSTNLTVNLLRKPHPHRSEYLQFVRRFVGCNPGQSCIPNVQDAVTEWTRTFGPLAASGHEICSPAVAGGPGWLIDFMNACKGRAGCPVPSCIRVHTYQTSVDAFKGYVVSHYRRGNINYVCLP